MLLNKKKVMLCNFEVQLILYLALNKNLTL